MSKDLAPLARRVGSAAALAAAAAALAPMAAQAATVNGAVVARDAHRGTLVVASGGGSVSTLRVASTSAAKVGRRVRATAVQLADGSYKVSRLRVTGHSRRVKVRATVVRRSAHGYLVSAGGSTFSLRLRRAAHGRRASAAAVDTSGTAQPGDVIVATTDPAGGEMETADVQVTGQSPVTELQGILTSVSDTQLSIAVEHQGLVTVAIPAGVTVQGKPGDELQLMVSVGADGSFTLVSAAGDDDAEGHDSGFQVDGEHGQVEVHGVITAVAPDSVSVQAGQSAPITCAVPAGVDVSGFAVGDQVELKCVTSGTTLTLHQMESDHAHAQAQGSGENEDQGDSNNESDGDQPAAPAGSQTSLGGGDHSGSDN